MVAKTAVWSADDLDRLPEDGNRYEVVAGELFVLDMGEQIRIADLARDLIRLSGLEAGVDIEFTYTGVRPGEKLYEEVLFGGEDVRTTNHPKVLRTVQLPNEEGFLEMVESLIRRAATNGNDEADLRDLLHELVPEFSLEDARTDPRQRPSPYPTTAAARPQIQR